MRLPTRHLAVTILTLVLGACLDPTLGAVGQVVADSDATATDAVGTKDVLTVLDTPVSDDATIVIDVPVISTPGCPPLPATPQVLVQEDYWVMQPKGVTSASRPTTPSSSQPRGHARTREWSYRLKARRSTAARS